MTAHADFAAALLDPDVAVPDGLVAWNGSDPARRFAVYRNNVTSALTDVLADSFPVTQQLVGEEFFRAMARIFLRGSPPRSPLMTGYGEGFPAFVADFAPAREVPFLADVARLEWLRLRALHAADAATLMPDDVARALADPDRLPGLRLRVHPAAGVIRSTYAVISLWAAHHGVGRLDDIDPFRPESALVVRPAIDVEVVRLPPGGDRFVVALADGFSLGEAADAAGASPDFNLAATLALLIRHGALGAP
jgi:hypothetical protein